MSSDSNKTVEILDRARRLAEADEDGDAKAHAELLGLIRELQLAVEKPPERIQRVRFQVSLRGSVE